VTQKKFVSGSSLLKHALEKMNFHPAAKLKINTNAIKLEKSTRNATGLRREYPVKKVINDNVHMYYGPFYFSYA